MRKFYSTLFTLLLTTLCAFSAVAAEWSWDWPISATKDKDTGYANGYYNFGTSAVGDLTTLTRTFNEKTWTATFDAGCILAYTASGQTIGQANKACTETFTMTSDSFAGKILSVIVEARTAVENATVSVSVGGTDYLCDNAAAAPFTTSGTALTTLTFTPAGDAVEGVVTITLKAPGATKPQYLKSIAVSFDESQSAVAAPVITPAAGSYDAPFTATIAAAEGAEILYTIDGSSPRTDGIPYTAPVEINESLTLRAVARVADDFSAVVEAPYILRADPQLSATAESLTIELLEEAMMPLDNPLNLPVTYSTSNNSIAYCDKYGVIYTYGLGTANITATFAGNDTYLPASVTVAVEVIAKEPLAGLEASLPEGTYDAPLEVTFTCSDPRAKTLWYHVGTEPMTLDDLGVLDDFTINPSTTLKLTLDETCVVSVQAIGDNVWSEPLFLTYTLNQVLKADFTGPASYTTLYRNGFDSTDEANEWNTSDGASWQLTPNAGGYSCPAFSSINPDSQYSLFHIYANTGDVDLITSPDITLTENAKVRFHSLFNPVWIYFGNLELYICENAQGATPVKIWDANLAPQEAGSDDPNWHQYSVDLDAWAGKEVYFAFAYYLTDGDNVLIDDFEVIVPDDASSFIEVSTGEAVTFTNLSTGHPEACLWSLPGSDVEQSTEENPTVVYNRAGTYDVTLTVSRGDESATCAKPGYVIVRAQAPAAAIGIDAPGCYHSPEACLVVPVGKEVTFFSTSSGAPTDFNWTLPGTDTPSATTPSVTVKYEKEGMFDVDLTVSNDAGSSSTYLHGIKAGGTSLAWNIPAAENDKLDNISLSWYGWYGGTNWLDMEAFAERFEAPAAEATIDAVNVYFAKATTVTPDAEIRLALTRVDESGMPGEELATATLKASELVDASTTYNDPTTFSFDKEVTVNEPFFITISGFPNNSSADGEDAIAMFALRHGETARNTAHHLLAETDSNYQPTGEKKWYAQADDPCSFAIAPRISFKAESGSAVETVDRDALLTTTPVYYTVAGLRVDANRLIPGIYIERRGTQARKIVVR